MNRSGPRWCSRGLAVLAGDRRVGYQQGVALVFVQLRTTLTLECALERRRVDAEFVAQHGEFRRPRVLRVYPDDVVGFLDILMDLGGRDAAVEADHRPGMPRTLSRGVPGGEPAILSRISRCSRAIAPPRRGRMPEPAASRNLTHVATTPAWLSFARAGVSAAMASSRAAQADSTSPQFSSGPPFSRRPAASVAAGAPKLATDPLRACADFLRPDLSRSRIARPISAIRVGHSSRKSPASSFNSSASPSTRSSADGQVEGRGPGRLVARCGRRSVEPTRPGPRRAREAGAVWRRSRPCLPRGNAPRSPFMWRGRSWQ